MDEENTGYRVTNSKSIIRPVSCVANRTSHEINMFFY